MLASCKALILISMNGYYKKEATNLQLMVITNNKRLLIYPQEEYTLPTISNTDSFGCCYHMNSFTMFNSYSLYMVKNIFKFNYETTNSQCSGLQLQTHISGT